jgi:oxygen-dependent protoporphyrinogen oxidase
VILIIGGGITGLAAAYELARRSIPFRLHESSASLGGLIRTEHQAGFTIDSGPDSILAQKPAALQLCEEVGLGPRVQRTTPPRTSFVLKDGRLHPLPGRSVLGIPTTIGGLARYDLLPSRARARIALEPLVPRGGGDDESVASFFRRRFGRATVDLIAEPLLGGIHAGYVDRLSVQSLFPRLVQAERARGRVLLSLRRRSSSDPSGIFRSLAGGMGELVDAIVSRLPHGSVQLDSAAAALRRDGASWAVDHPGGDTAARAVVIAAPAHVAAHLLAAVDPDAAAICRQVPYVSTASVALGFRRQDVGHPLAGSGFVVARRYADARITACTWVSSKWAGRAPKGHVLLRAFLGGAHDPHVVDLSDEELVNTAIRDLSATLGITGGPVVTRVARWRNAGAQHNVGHRAATAALASRLRGWPGLFVAGSGFESIGIPDCVSHGRAAAAAAAEYVRS